MVKTFVVNNIPVDVDVNPNIYTDAEIKSLLRTGLRSETALENLSSELEIVNYREVVNAIKAKNSQKEKALMFKYTFDSLELASVDKDHNIKIKDILKETNSFTRAQLTEKLEYMFDVKLKHTSGGMYEITGTFRHIKEFLEFALLHDQDNLKIALKDLNALKKSNK